MKNTIKSIISILIIMSLFATELVYILPTRATAAPSISTSTDNGIVEGNETVFTQKIDTDKIKNDGNLVYSDDGQVIGIINSNEYSAEQINFAFGINNIKTTSARAEKTKGQEEMIYLKDRWQFNDNEIAKSIALHSSYEILQYELENLDLAAEILALKPEVYKDIQTLVINGFTSSQAFAAYISSDILGYTIDELAEWKAEEIDNEQKDTETYAIDDYLDNEEMTLNEEYFKLSIKMGVPYSAVENTMLNSKVSISSLADAFDIAYKATFSSHKQTNNKSLTFSSKLFDENGSLILEKSSVFNVPLSQPFSNYAPEKILEKPFTYLDEGNLDINLNNGKYSYTENDLSIPGVNGLDLNIIRRYDSDRSMDGIPLAYAGDPYYLEDHCVSVGFKAFEYRWETDEDGNPKFHPVNIANYYYDASTLVYFYYRDENNMITIPYYDSTTGGYNLRFNGIDYEKAVDYYTGMPTMIAVAHSKSDPSEFIMTALKPTIWAISPNIDNALVNITSPYNYCIDDYGLGQGWSLGFSRIEIYNAGFRSQQKKKLITSDGKQYEIDFAKGGSNLVDYDLTDMYMVNSGSGYNGAWYTLAYKDGKKEYFNEAGKLIAIVDRYNNKITFAYATGTITITDTVGNIIVYANTSMSGAQVVNGKEVNTKWTLTLNGQIIKEYYSFNSPNGIRELRIVGNESAEYTVYNSGSSLYKFNSYIPTHATNDGTIKIVKLNSVEYPNKLNMQFLGTNAKERLGYAGYRQYVNATKVVNIEYYRDAAGNPVAPYYHHYKMQQYEYGDFSALDPYVATLNDKYYTKVTDSQIKRITGDCTWGMKQVAYQFSHTSHLKTAEHQYNWDAVQDSQISTISDYSFYTNSARYDNYESRMTTYLYNANNLPTAITNSYYNEDTSTPSMTENHLYTYDNQGNVLTETKPNGQVITYTYNNAYSIPLTQTYKQDANTTILMENTLTADGKSVGLQTIKSNNAVQAKREYTYYPNGNLSIKRDYQDQTNFVETQYIYQNNAQASEIKTLGVMDVNGTLVAGSPGYGNGIIVQKYGYNTRGWVTSQTDPKGFVSEIDYDNTGRITQVTNADGSYTTYNYDVAKNKVTHTNELGTVLEYRYDAAGNVIGVYDVAGQQLLSSATYDSANRLIQEVQYNSTGNNKTTYYFYDTDGRLIEKGTKNIGGMLTSQETYSYTYADNSFKTTKTVVGDTDSPSVETTSYTDNMGNVVKTGKILNGTEYQDAFTYDYLGNRLTEKSAYTASLGGAFTNSYTYDYAGRVLSATDALNRTAYKSYDWLGRQLTEIDFNGSVSQFTYDVLSRMLKKLIPFSSTGATTNYAETRYVYDQNGNVTSQYIKNNAPGAAESWSQTDYAYNNRNKLLKVTTYDAGLPENYTQYYYDSLGNMLRMYTGLSAPLTIMGLDNVSGSDNSYSVTQYAYNRFSKMTTMIDPLLQAESYTYDINGNMLSKTDRNSNVTTYGYDDLARLVSVNVATADGSGDISLNYTYTLTGLKRSESNSTGTTLYVYDKLGRLTQESYSGSGVTTVKNYGYNIGGDRTSFALTAGGVQQYTTTYGYDALNRLTSMTQGTTTAVYGYDTNGNRDYVQYNNGLREEYDYNLANQLTVLTNKNSGGSVLSRFTYTYKLDGNQTSKTDHTGKINTYIYDDLGRLVSETESSGGQTQVYSYTYDDSSNRASMTATGPETYATTYVYDLNNRLQTESKTVSGTSNITSYFYDLNGNQITKTAANVTVGAGTVVYELIEGLDDTQLNRYNGLNQLMEVKSDTGTAGYTYFANGLRASKTINGTKVDFVLDGDNVALEWSSNAVTAKYIRAINLISSTIGSTTSYYLYNGHGDVVQLTDASGNATKSYDYDAFGNEKDNDPNDTNPFRYCGEYYDLETNTYYLRARNYDPTTGRFLSEDPVKSGLNWYTYCNNNPINFFDPSGLVAVNLFGYAKTYEGSNVYYDGETSCYVVEWGGKSFTVAYDLENIGDLIDDSVFINNFGVGNEKLVVYQDWITGNVSIRATFNITGDGADSVIDGTSYRALFLQGVEDYWSGTFGSYAVSTYTGESSKGIKVNINNELGVSNMRAGLFGWSGSNPGRITMYSGDSRGNGDLYSSSQYMFVSAHEFGHILGVGDAYNSKSSTGVTSIYNGFGTGVQEGDIAMVLNAWSTGKWQKWP